jgi:opacity protein-like surface antigen
MKNFRCFLVFLLVLAAVPAYAAEDLTLFGAAQHPGKLTLQSAQTTVTTTSNFDPGTFGTYGLRFSHGKIIGGEHTFAYTPNFVGGHARGFIYNSDFMLQAPLPKIQPYAVAGMGFIFTWGTNSAGQPDFSKMGDKFALNYGGGLKIFPAGPVGVRFDIRGYAIPSASFNLPALVNPVNQSVVATVKSQTQTLNLLEVGLGVVFKF